MVFTSTRERRFLWAALGTALLAGSAWLWWQCARNPNINFLCEDGPRLWIIYPKPPNPLTYNGLETVAEFHRFFQLEKSPEKAALIVRAFRHFDIKINGLPVTPSTTSNSNWKNATELSVAKFLHAGTNEIRVIVSNNNSPPALSLSLDAGAQSIVTDTNWEVSLLGAVWRNAWPASVPMPFEKGNPLYGGEYTLDALRESLPVLLLFTLISSAVAYGVAKSARRFKTGNGNTNTLQRMSVWLVIVLAILWAALFANNLRFLPHELGYDEPAHEDYINFVRTRKALPLANQGWEMYQPPLYYIVGAGIAAASGADTATDRAATALRIFGLLVGVAHVALIFLCLRMLFPNCPGAQWFGTILAACLPEHLYISQYVTNEFLAAGLVTAALYFCLRLLQNETPSPRLALAIGICLGAALLTKLTALLAVPFITGILVLQICRRAPSSPVGPRLGALAVVFLAAFAVAGWHYLRVWQHFGTPIVNNWDTASGYTWWADNGFQTAHYYTAFGQSLVQPRYSAFHGFWDGLYSTLWGDSLDAGNASLENRPPWNYTLMTAGFLLALLPTLIIVIGFGVSLIRFLREPQPAWFLLLGIAVTTYAALFYMSLKVPCYSQVKAFYALITLLPMCACGAAGWEWLSKYSNKLRLVLYVSIGIWALNSYASFWVRTGASTTHTARGNYFSREGRSRDAIAELQKALAMDPHNVTARMLLANEWSQSGNLAASRRETEQLLSEAPNHPAGLMQLALLQAADGHLNQAIQTTRHITEVAPAFALAYEKLSRGMMQMGKYSEAIEAARGALRITPFRAEIHFLLGFALDANGEHLQASRHFQLASDLKPSWAEPHYQLGLSLAALGRWMEAIPQFKEACRLRPEAPEYSLHLGEAYAQAGQFDDAIACATRAMKAAEARHDAKALALGQKMLDSYQAHQLFRRETALPAHDPNPAN